MRRRRRRRSRVIGAVLGIAGFGSLAFLTQPINPEHEGSPDRFVASSPGGEFAQLSFAARPIPQSPQPSAAQTAAADTVVASGNTAGSANPAAQAQAPAQTIEARPGDTPLKLLARMGVAPEDAQAAIRQLSTVWNPRDLKAGQKAAVFVQSDRLLSIRLALAPDRDIVVARDDRGNFVAEDQDRPTHQVAALGAGTIHSSLSEAASRARVPPAVLDELIRAFSYDVDFQREIHAGDSFTVLYQRIDDEFGRPTGTGRLVYGEMVLSGTRLRLYRFTPKDGEPGYYNAVGENIRKSLLRTPVDGAHITSGFGMRFHPILGYSRMHRGTDFAAPIGTAIYAAGDGVVTRAGQANGYGNYVEIEHNQQYATAYGHLSAFARGVHEGMRVRQGEVIGYVGMSGLATGPHLHYEVHYQGVQIDPLSVKMPAMTTLAGDDLKAFQAAREAVEQQLIDLRQDLVAHADCGRGRSC